MMQQQDNPTHYCGVHLPTKDEVRRFVEEEGLEVTPTLPGEVEVVANQDPDVRDLGLLEAPASLLTSALRMDSFSVGSRIVLPDSVPTVWAPGNGKPYWGARRGRIWNRRTRRTVRLVRDKVRKGNGRRVICATYWGHGRTDIWYGIDVMFSDFTEAVNKAEHRAAREFVEWVMRNWDRLWINYIIYNDRMNDGAGWFDYGPLRRRWGGGSSNPVAAKHKDHVHLQVNSPFIAGNE